MKYRKTLDYFCISALIAMIFDILIGFPAFSRFVIVIVWSAISLYFFAFRENDSSTFSKITYVLPLAFMVFLSKGLTFELWGLLGDLETLAAIIMVSVIESVLAGLLVCIVVVPIILSVYKKHFYIVAFLSCIPLALANLEQMNGVGEITRLLIAIDTALLYIIIWFASSFSAKKLTRRSSKDAVNGAA